MYFIKRAYILNLHFKKPQCSVTNIFINSDDIATNGSEQSLDNETSWYSNTKAKFLICPFLSVAFLPTVISHLTSVSPVYGNKESDLTKKQLSKICMKRVVVNLLCSMLNLVCLEIENSKLSIKSPTSLDLQDLTVLSTLINPSPFPVDFIILSVLYFNP